MTKTIKIKRGYDIRLSGKAEKSVSDPGIPETVALKPSDFLGMLHPKLLVQEGDQVKAGTPLLIEKSVEKVKYASPVSGEVIEIKRGEKRKLLEIKILPDSKIEYFPFKRYTTSELIKLSKEEIIDHLCEGGVWPQIIQRPFGYVANPDDTPRDIFISGFDSHPLAPDINFIIQGQDSYIQAAVDVLAKLTTGQVHLSINANAEFPSIFSKLNNIILHKFSGPHPAGNVGVQIHHIKPINKGELVWTITPTGLIEVGKLFLEGRYDTSKLIALVGSEVLKPQYFRAVGGIKVAGILNDLLKSDHVRIISGNVLTGERIEKSGFLGYYHNMITVIPEGDDTEFLGWLMPSTQKLSIHKAFGLMSFLNPSTKEYKLSTNLRGEKRSFVETGVFEKVFPMDIYPTYLFKAILAEDYDEMEALGIYELLEEDVALCEFVDVSKHDIQKILRQGLTLLHES